MRALHGDARMDSGRRTILKSGGGLTLLALATAAGWLDAEEALAETWNKAAFDTHSLGDTLTALGGSEPARSTDIEFVQTPEIAENGAVVPVGVTSRIPKTESI